MLKKYFYPAFFICFALMTGVILFFGKKKEAPEVKERKALITPASEWINARAAMEDLRTRIRRNPDDNKAKVHLALAYIQESRITGDHGYYDPAALELLNEVLRKEPENFDALCGKATVYLSGHHFVEAIPIAREASQLNPYSAFAYGLLVDGYVELGEYGKAVEMAEKMISARPDLRSYSRVSYLREIHGDYPGAIEAMDMAVKAGQPGLEQTAWARVHLGQLYEQTGKLTEAAHHYRTTLEERPHYAYAWAGLGRIASAKQQYEEALDCFRKAGKAINDPGFTEEMAEVYSLTGQPEKAAQAARQVINALQGEGHTGKEDSDHAIGHYADLELASAYLRTNQPEQALQHALAEYQRRPGNIEVNEALGWVYYKLGDYPKAQKCIEGALKTGSQKPALLYKAGLIRMKTGSIAEGQALLEKALSINPHLSRELQLEGQAYLAKN